MQDERLARVEHEAQVLAATAQAFYRAPSETPAECPRLGRFNEPGVEDSDILYAFSTQDWLDLPEDRLYFWKFWHAGFLGVAGG
jgi:hypothetical protein